MEVKMTGLDKIIKVIEADAKASVERILNEAKEEEIKLFL
jgi:vacuolar-type H+-ATPase subunit E/Vma4